MKVGAVEVVTVIVDSDFGSRFNGAGGNEQDVSRTVVSVRVFAFEGVVI